MKILMFGRGVIAAIYGWAFEKAGHSVDFYVRPGRAKEYGAQMRMEIYDLRKRWTGVKVEETLPIRLREDLPADHDYDLIVVSVQHYRFAEVVEFLSTRAGKATILLFNNVLEPAQAAVASLPAEQVVWGFPMAGGGFGKDGVLRGSLFPKIVLGSFGMAFSERALNLRSLFEASGFGIDEQRDFQGWLLAHFIVNAGVHSEVLRAGSMATMLRSPDHIRAVLSNVRELVPLFTARGVDVSGQAQLGVLRVPPLIAVLAVRLILWLSPAVRLVLTAHANPDEPRATCRDALAEARRLGVAVPRLEASEEFFA